jgi:hypothetical protein
MKNKKCIGYDAITEVEKKEVGSARGKVIYAEKEIILSETCSIRKLKDNFDCTDCPFAPHFSQN